MCLISSRVGDLNPFPHFFELPRSSCPYLNFLVLLILVTYTVKKLRSLVTNGVNIFHKGVSQTFL